MRPDSDTRAAHYELANLARSGRLIVFIEAMFAGL